jgi:hypothetical protein
MSWYVFHNLRRPQSAEQLPFFVLRIYGEESSFILTSFPYISYYFFDFHGCILTRVTSRIMHDTRNPPPSMNLANRIWAKQVQKLRNAMSEYENDRWRIIASKVGSGFTPAACREKAQELEVVEQVGEEGEEEGDGEGYTQGDIAGPSSDPPVAY